MWTMAGGPCSPNAALNRLSGTLMAYSECPNDHHCLKALRAVNIPGTYQNTQTGLPLPVHFKLTSLRLLDYPAPKRECTARSYDRPHTGREIDMPVQWQSTPSSLGLHYSVVTLGTAECDSHRYAAIFTAIGVSLPALHANLYILPQIDKPLLELRLPSVNSYAH